MTYKPQQRTSTVQVYTADLGWIRGEVHLPVSGDLRAAFNDPKGWFRMTNVSLPNALGKVPFLAIQRDNVIIVAASEGSKEDPLAKRAKVSTGIACVFRNGFVTGNAWIIENTRISDFLGTVEGFIELREAVLHTGDITALARYLSQDQPPLGSAMPVALVNPSALVGVLEAKKPAPSLTPAAFSVPMGS